MKILFIGDVVGSAGRACVSEVLPTLKKERCIDFVVANADNLAHGRGATEGTIQELIDIGVDYFTGGDHLFWHRGFEDHINDLPVLRPANYPARVPGKGTVFIKNNKLSILLLNLMGRTFLNDRLNDPFTKADEILDQYSTEAPDFILVDFHAESTSEKATLGFYLDGRVTAVVGTHTHVPTCDTMLLPKGTMFVTDVGMSGVIDSVLGVRKEIILSLYLTAQNQKFEWENAGRRAFRSVLLDSDKKCIERIDLTCRQAVS